MPTFSAITLDRLLEPGAAKTNSNKPPPPSSKLERRNSTSTTTEKWPAPPSSRLERRNSTSTTTEKKFQWAQRSPALYATPEPAPLPDSPSSFPPSPYIINHKRRGPRLLKSFSEENVAAQRQKDDKVSGSMSDSEKEVHQSGKDGSGTSVAITVPDSIEGNHVNGFYNGEIGDSKLADANGIAKENDAPNCGAANAERDTELEDFFDPQESMSFSSNTDGEDYSGAERSLKLNTPNGEFFDAWEELSNSNDSTPQPTLHDVDAELREMRLSLLMEIEKRKQAEEALNNLRSHWKRICQELSLVGLNLPSEPSILSSNEQVTSDPVGELLQQVYVARFVSECVGRGLAKAEVEKEMQYQIESKNFEIARLLDRLHYYEAVNREMSQRNQESIEMARRDRQRRKRRQRWFWGLIGTAITLGTATLAWSYLPTSRGSSSTNNSESPDQDYADAS